MYNNSKIKLTLFIILWCLTAGNIFIAESQTHCKVLIFVEPDLCNENNVILHASPWNYTPPFSYLWSTGAMTQDITVPAGSGTYSVTISDSNGCTATHSVDLNAFNFTFNIEQFGGCPNEDAQLAINWHHYTYPGNYEFSWSNGDMTSIATITTSGTYTVTITDPDTGCSVELSFDAVFYPEPMPVITGPSFICSGESAQLTVTGGPFSNIYWFPGGWDTETVTITEPDIYTVTVYSEFGCIGLAEFEVLSGGIQPLLDGPGYLCPGQNGQIAVTNEDEFEFFLWSTGSTVSTTNISGPGLYYITVTDINNCESTALFEVLGSEFEISGVVTDNTSCTAPSGAIDVTVTPPGSYSYIWTNGSMTEDRTSRSGGSYTITVSDGNGCSSTTTFIVNENTSLPVVTSVITQASCGQNNGAVNITVTPPGTYSFMWSDGTLTEDNDHLSPGMYTVTVTSTSGCTSVHSAEVTNVNNSFSVTGTIIHNTSCTAPSGAIDITVTPPASYSYIWTNGAMTEDLTSLSGGSYTVTVSDGNGCSSTATFVVNENTLFPVVTSVITPASCGQNNGAINITVTPPGTYSYIWSDASTTEDNDNLSPGMYTVTVTSTSGCTSVHSAEVTNVNNSFSVTGTIIHNTSCTAPSGTIDITVTPPGSYSYIWTNGAMTEDLTSLSGGSYTVTVSDGNGCSSTATFVVNENTLFPVVTSVITPANCGQNNGAINITVTPPGTYSYIWSDASTTEDNDNLSPGIYTVTVTSTSGCTSVHSAEVTNVNNSFSVTGTITHNTSCTAPSGAIDITVTPPGSYSYIWTNGSMTEDLTSLSGGSYTVTVSDGNNCSSKATFMVNENTLLPVVTSVITPANCGQNNGAINITVTPPGTYSYIWSDATTTEDNENLSPGIYAVTVTSTSGCTSVHSAEVTNVNNSFSVTGTITHNTSCTAPTGAIDVTVTPSGSYTYNWTNGSMTEDLTSLSVGSYTVTVSDGNGCSSTTTFIVNENTSLPVVTSVITPASCGQNNGAINITVTPPGTYSFMWSDATTTEDNDNLPPGIYTVTVTSTSGCTSVHSAEVTNVNNSFSISGTVKHNTSCTSPTGAIDVTVTPPGSYSYIWTNGSRTEDLTSLSGGSYAVTVSDGNGCSSTTTFIVNENTSLPVVTSVTTPASCGQNNGAINITVTPLGTYSFMWSDATTTEDNDNLPPGIYTVTVTSTSGCTAVHSAEVTNVNNSFSISGTVSTILHVPHLQELLMSL
ncbi:MAG: hypothetical protein IPN10_09955 [Saprospiraceae bacterium]|nr:hypothetical protein [Saprospiraceae bacterium]